eukprot:TRINITY_DN8410_c1_g2_i1.p1 TRINITY_DN8410_c1_g2~~TRINITY_DN8410_c1_g2_i1.p1  ORF type:complete len:626 (+),score=124.31 TRINITY_DN8410_c1_g2_i1:177-2054(+)
MESMYKVLGVQPNSSQTVLRAGYRRRILEVHPDKGGSVELCQKVLSAFEFLSDDTRRRKYDAYLSALSSEGTKSSSRVSPTTSNVKCPRQAPRAQKHPPCKKKSTPRNRDQSFRPTQGKDFKTTSAGNRSRPAAGTNQVPNPTSKPSSPTGKKQEEVLLSRTVELLRKVSKDQRRYFIEQRISQQQRLALEAFIVRSEVRCDHGTSQEQGRNVGHSDPRSVNSQGLQSPPGCQSPSGAQRRTSPVLERCQRSPRKRPSVGIVKAMNQNSKRVRMTRDRPAEAEVKAKAMAKPQQVCHSTQQTKQQQQQQRHQHQQEGADVQNADGPLKQERPNLDSKAVAEASKVASTRPACESAVEAVEELLNFGNDGNPGRSEIASDNDVGKKLDDDLPVELLAESLGPLDSHSAAPNHKHQEQQRHQSTSSTSSTTSTTSATSALQHYRYPLPFEQPAPFDSSNANRHRSVRWGFVEVKEFESQSDMSAGHINGPPTIECECCEKRVARDASGRNVTQIYRLAKSTYVCSECVESGDVLAKAEATDCAEVHEDGPEVSQQHHPQPEPQQEPRQEQQQSDRQQLHVTEAEQLLLSRRSLSPYFADWLAASGKKQSHNDDSCSNKNSNQVLISV